MALKEYASDIAGLVGLVALSAGVAVNYGIGWALMTFGAGLFGLAIFVSWVTRNAAAPTQ